MKKGYILLESVISLMILSIISAIVLAISARTIVMYKEILYKDFKRLNAENSILSLFKLLKYDIKPETIEFKEYSLTKQMIFLNNEDKPVIIEKYGNDLSVVYINEAGQKTRDYLYRSVNMSDLNYQNKIMKFRFDNYELNIYSEEW
ncbi:hypothetical protein XO10_07685 [Marinitoga sp. 1135]|uniref:Uncharacterized protein n=1 Tax=Marinitoga piezophila (strain DSM 14283 / JCM 11233 / KA3) TaxID=443254 RepID=H2J4K7_MARPK|nr:MULTISPECIES: type II secretion system protein [Marinitoga]AEX85949.1 hypothetical protein Marpi_1559 [Marinitoga piezophila KA3]APT76377.1 hypothetical protein LN42_08305 [Marinitoga sp. 1137]NUU96147.1 hypothetical protein [Marinitoga sp. 1135]NUU98055.1 hypothetical protein [Marinitoga sp. 1138]